MSFPTATGASVEGQLHREPQMCLGPTYAGATYQFFLTGTTTAANVYEDGALTTPFPITGLVTADNFGRFPPIYLDPSVTYKAQLYDSQNNLVWTVDPYVAPLATTGTSSKVAYGLNIAKTGEVTLPAPIVGGTGITLTLNAGAIGSAPLKISSLVPGNSPLIINSSATTGAQTATFTASNKPGTAASTPAGWLPITCDGVQYYTPIWHGNNFTPYVASPSAVGEVITGQSVVFGGNGVTTVTGGTANPGNWFAPSAANIGASYYINVTKTGGLSGLAFSAAQGAWTNITSGGLTISSNAAAQITGTYQLSSNVSGSPLVASGTITLSGNNGVQQPTYNGTPNLVLAGNGTATLNGAASGSYYSPTTANIGSGLWINITRTGGTSGVNFSAAQGAWTNITSGGITVGLTSSTGNQFASGTYQISSNSSGTAVLGTGSITLTNAPVLSPNWSGTAPLLVGGNGTATLNGVATSSWYSPTTAGVGASYWFNITRTGGTSGVNFSAAQGSWTNIGSGGLSINLTGYTGDVGTATASGTWQISSSSGGSPVLGSGSISLSVSGLTVIHVYMSGSGTETIPTGTTNATMDAIGGGAAGGARDNTDGIGGGGGGGGGRSHSVYSAAALGGPGRTFSYSVAAAVTAAGANGLASTISAGSVTGFAAMSSGTAVGGAAGTSGGAGGAGGAASGGNSSNTNGNAGAAQSGGTGGNGGGGQNSLISGGGGPYGAGGIGATVTPGNPAGNGLAGAVVFYYA